MSEMTLISISSPTNDGNDACLLVSQKFFRHCLWTICSAGVTEGLDRGWRRTGSGGQLLQGLQVQSAHRLTDEGSYSLTRGQSTLTRQQSTLTRHDNTLTRQQNTLTRQGNTLTGVHKIAHCGIIKKKRKEFELLDRIIHLLDSRIHWLNRVIHLLDRWRHLLDSRMHLLDRIMHLLDSRIHLLERRIHLLDSRIQEKISKLSNFLCTQSGNCHSRCVGNGT